jgi:hypothetical protein
MAAETTNDLELLIASENGDGGQQRAYESNKLLKQEVGGTAGEVVEIGTKTVVRTSCEDGANAKHDQGRWNGVGVTPVVKCF